MDKYLDILRKIKSDEDESLHPLLEKLELYIKGEITPDELLEDPDNRMKGVIYYTINKILNYKDKEIRYYMRLPQDMFFNVSSGYNIIAAKIDKFKIQYNLVNVVGPNYFKQKRPSLCDNYYIEIDGDFSQIPNGVMLHDSDWVRIIKKYPYIIERMSYLMTNDEQFGHRYKNKSNDEMKQLVLNELQKFLEHREKIEAKGRFDTCLGWEEKQYLSQETIDSITFIQQIEYLTQEEVLNGTFGTFKEILNGQKNQNKNVQKKR